MNQYDDHFADNLSQPAPGEKPKRGWFKRNWLWLVPLIILLPVFCCCGVPIGGYFIFQEQLLKASPYYLEPMVLVEQSDAAQAALGSPIDGGKPDVQADPTGNGQTIISKFSVTGPNGSGMVVAEYDVSDPFMPLMVSAVLTVDSTNETIDLIDDESDPIEDDTGELIDSAVDAIERSREE